MDAKIARAHHHAADLDRVLATAFNTDRQTFAFDPNVQNGEHVYRVYGVPDIDPLWSLIVGDCISNLRSALDHLAWQLVEVADETPDDKTQFPIREAPFDKKGRITRTKLHPIKRVDILDLVEEAQPYVGLGGRWVDSHESPLWILGQLNNIDKHRLMLVVASVFDFTRMWWGVNPSDPSIGLRVNTAPLENGDPVAWFDFHGADPPSNFNPHPALQVVLRERVVRPYHYEPVGELLRMLINTIEHFTIGHLFRRLFA